MADRRRYPRPDPRRYPRRSLSAAPGDALRFYVSEIETEWSFHYGPEVTVRLVGTDGLDLNRMLALVGCKVALIEVKQEARRG